MSLKGNIPWNKGLKTGPNKEHSKKMKELYKNGLTLWNKGTKGIMKSNKTSFKKGFKHSDNFKDEMSNRMKGNNYGFIPGFTPYNKGKIFPERSGKNHWNWKGGITPFNRALRTKSIWKIWREAVFLRDNFTCQNPNCKFCNNKIGVMLHPHHIKPLSLYPDLTFKINNGITYCAEYHLKGKLHRGLKCVA